MYQSDNLLLKRKMCAGTQRVCVVVQGRLAQHGPLGAADVASVEGVGISRLLVT